MRFFLYYFTHFYHFFNKILFDVYYRAHVQDIGWQGWVKALSSEEDGGVYPMDPEVVPFAGTVGQLKRMEAIEIAVVVPKELADARKTGKELVQSAYNSLLEADEYTANKAELDEVLENALSAIDEAKNEEAVAEEVRNAIEALKAVKTDAKILADAKTDAKATVDDYFNNLDTVTYSKYGALTDVVDLINDFSNDLYNTKTPDEVKEVLDTLMEKLDEIAQNVSDSVALGEAKEDALKKLEDAFNSKKLDPDFSKNLQEIVDTFNEGSTNIYTAEDEDAVNQALQDALDKLDAVLDNEAQGEIDAVKETLEDALTVDATNSVLTEKLENDELYNGSLYGKTVDELQTVTGITDGKVQGSLNYVDEYDQWAEDAAGNFVAFYIDNPEADSIEVCVNDKNPGLTLPEGDHFYVLQLTDPAHITLTIKFHKGDVVVEKVYSFEQLSVESFEDLKEAAETEILGYAETAKDTRSVHANDVDAEATDAIEGALADATTKAELAQAVADAKEAIDAVITDEDLETAVLAKAEAYGDSAKIKEGMDLENESDIWGMTLDQLQENVTVSDENVVSGNLKYVENFDNFATGAEGNFLVLRFVNTHEEVAKIKATINPDGKTEVPLTADGLLIAHFSIPSEVTVTVKYYNEDDVVIASEDYKMSGLTLESKEEYLAALREVAGADLLAYAEELGTTTHTVYSEEVKAEANSAISGSVAEATSKKAIDEAVKNAKEAMDAIENDESVKEKLTAGATVGGTESVNEVIEKYEDNKLLGKSVEELQKDDVTVADKKVTGHVNYVVDYNSFDTGAEGNFVALRITNTYADKQIAKTTVQFTGSEVDLTVNGEGNDVLVLKVTDESKNTPLKVNYYMNDGVKVTVEYDLSGLVLQSKEEMQLVKDLIAGSVVEAYSEDQAYEKDVTDLQESVTVEDNTITGKLLYVEGYEGFSSIETDKEGNYLAISIKNTAELSDKEVKIEVLCANGPVEITDGYIVLRFTETSSNKLTVRYTVDDVVVEVVYDLDLTLQTKQQKADLATLKAVYDEVKTFDASLQPEELESIYTNGVTNINNGVENALDTALESLKEETRGAIEAAIVKVYNMGTEYVLPGAEDEGPEQTYVNGKVLPNDAYLQALADLSKAENVTAMKTAYDTAIAARIIREQNDLNKAKVDAKATIAEYKGGSKNFIKVGGDGEELDESYSTAISTFNSSLESAGSTDDVVRALKTAKSAIDAVLTGAQTTAKGELDSKKTELESDRSESEEALTSAVDNGKTAIDVATSLQGVEDAKQAAIEAMNAVPTDTEKEAAELKAAKDQALQDLETYLNTELEDTFTEEGGNKDSFESAIENVKSEINSASSKEEPDQKLQAFKSTVAGLDSDAELLAARKTAKETVNSAIDTEFAADVKTLLEKDYTTEIDALIETLKSTFEAKIDVAKTVTAINEIKDGSENIKTESVKVYRDFVKGLVDTYVPEEGKFMSEEACTELKGILDSKTTMAEIKTEFEKIGEKATEFATYKTSEIEKLKTSLNDASKGLGQDVKNVLDTKYNAVPEIKALLDAIDENDALVAAENPEDLATALKAIEEEVVKALKTYVEGLLKAIVDQGMDGDKYLKETDYRDSLKAIDEATDVENVIKAYDNVIDSKLVDLKA